MRRGRHCSRH